MSAQECPLSSRELEILELVATGVTNSQIARDLEISPNTVKVHLRNIFAKLEVESRTEATTLAIRQGWIRIGAELAADASGEGLAVAGEGPALARQEPLPLWRRIAFGVLLCAVLLVALWPNAPTSQGSPSDAFADHAAAVGEGLVRSGVSRWTEGARMPTARARLAFVALDGLLYAIGGDSAQGISNLVEVYDPSTDLWSRRAGKPTPVANVGAAAWQGRLYVPGGYTASGEATDVLEIYDPALDTWSSGPPMPEPLFGYALAITGGKLILFGGSNGSGYRDVTYVYDLRAEAWSMGASSGAQRAFAAATVADDGLIYVLGGYDGRNELDLCQRYDPQRDAEGAGAWSECAPMLAKRAGLGAASAAGQLYAIGGGWQDGLYFNEKYDPRSDMWASIETPVVGQWRTLGVAVLELDGEAVVYAVGGWNEGYLAVTEQFRPLFRVNLPSIP